MTFVRTFAAYDVRSSARLAQKRRALIDIALTPRVEYHSESRLVFLRRGVPFLSIGVLPRKSYDS